MSEPSPLTHPPRWITPLVLGVAVLAFLPTLGGGFLADDFVYIARFRELPWSEWPGLFMRDWSGGVWGQPLRELRPITALSFMSDARVFGADALGYRITNLLLHLIATLIVFRLAWLYTGGHRFGAALAGLVFALHPAHAEAVGWITGRVDLLATTGALLFWLAAEVYSSNGHTGRLVLAILAFVLGLYAKELCLFAPLLLLLRWLLLDLRAGRTVWLRRAAIFGGVAMIIVIYAACRRAAFPHDTHGYNVWTDLPAWHRQMSYAGWLLPLLPFTERSEFAAFPSHGVLHGVWIALAVATAGGLAWALWRGAKRMAAAVFFGGIWYFVTVAPLTAVVYHAPRHLYFPTVGFALALGLACAGARAARFVGIAMVVWLGAAHFAAIQPWNRAANASREALAQLQREMDTTGPEVFVASSVPPTLGPVWLWAWSSPQCFAPPFLKQAPAKIAEHPVNYSRSDPWMELRQPLETFRAAKTVIALRVNAQGRVACRRIPAAEQARHGEALAQRIARGLNPESWDEWIQSLVTP